jgi:pilus assembly protein Flp/PilA
MKQLLLKLWRDDDGQDMVEYALIAGLISIVAFAAVQTTGTSIGTIWNNVSTDMGTAAGGAGGGG